MIMYQCLCQPFIIFSISMSKNLQCKGNKCSFLYITLKLEEDMNTKPLNAMQILCIRLCMMLIWGIGILLPWDKK